MKKLFTLLAFTAAMAMAYGQTSEVPFTVISKVGEAGPRVVAVSVALFNGIPTGGLFQISGETPQQRDARVLNEVKAVPYRNVSIPVWITHADTDPVVSRIGSRIPFALMVDQGEVDASGELVPSKGTLKKSNAHERRYEGVGKTHKNAIRYTEYPFGNGDQFLELGMVTRNGHFSWEISYKDQEIINWMFAQKKR